MEYSTEKEILQPIFEHGMEGMSEVLQKLFNLAMRMERENALKASPYQRTEGRTGYANGFKERHIQSRVGELVLQIPGFVCSSGALTALPVNCLLGAFWRRSALTASTRWMTSNNRALPGIPWAFSEGETARQIVFSVRLSSATTRLVVMGSRLRSMHSTEA